MDAGGDEQRAEITKGIPEVRRRCEGKAGEAVDCCEAGCRRGASDRTIRYAQRLS